VEEYQLDPDDSSSEMNNQQEYFESISKEVARWLKGGFFLHDGRDNQVRYEMDFPNFTDSAPAQGKSNNFTHPALKRAVTFFYEGSSSLGVIFPVEFEILPVKVMALIATVVPHLLFRVIYFF
jgi:hypothetical protein